EDGSGSHIAQMHTALDFRLDNAVVDPVAEVGVRAKHPRIFPRSTHTGTGVLPLITSIFSQIAYYRYTGTKLRARACRWMVCDGTPDTGPMEARPMHLVGPGGVRGDGWGINALDGDIRGWPAPFEVFPLCAGLLDSGPGGYRRVGAAPAVGTAGGDSREQ